MSGLANIVEVRSTSKFGLSAVTVVFEDGTDIYFARQQIGERLAAAKEMIPPGYGEPELGPVSTGLGEIFQFEVRGDGKTAMDLRTIIKAAFFILALAGWATLWMAVFADMGASLLVVFNGLRLLGWPPKPRRASTVKTSQGAEVTS